MILPLERLEPARQDDGGRMMTSPCACTPPVAEPTARGPFVHESRGILLALNAACVACIRTRAGHAGYRGDAFPDGGSHENSAITGR